MRITHVITRLVVGGAQENTIATVLGLRDKPGIDVHLISGPTTGPEGSLELELDVPGGATNPVVLWPSPNQGSRFEPLNPTTPLPSLSSPSEGEERVAEGRERSGRPEVHGEDNKKPSQGVP